VRLVALAAAGALAACHPAARTGDPCAPDAGPFVATYTFATCAQAEQVQQCPAQTCTMVFSRAPDAGPVMVSVFNGLPNAAMAGNCTQLAVAGLWDGGSIEAGGYGPQTLGVDFFCGECVGP
jgi:hypothetical protein